MTVYNRKKGPPPEPVASMTRQGNLVVLRDKDGRVVQDEYQQAKAAVLPTRKADKLDAYTWRHFLRKMTNGGDDLLLNMIALANGIPHSVTHNGQESTPVIPSPEVRRAANMDLITLLHGKAVAQTEVIAAEKEASEAAQYQAMSDDALLKLVSKDPATLERLKRALGTSTVESDAEFQPALPAPDDD
jgi:hypothetical protein